jgi:hypothetical protein
VDVLGEEVALVVQEVVGAGAVTVDEQQRWCVGD